MVGTKKGQGVKGAVRKREFLNQGITVKNLCGFCALAVCLLISSAASAQNVNSTHLRVLTESQLGVITAGSADSSAGDVAGGTIVANGSTAVVTRGASVALSDNAGQGAQGLNLGNVADSAVANALNIWDGQFAEQPSATTGLDVEQSNMIQQDGARAATVRDYSRDPGSIETSSSTTDSTSSGSSTLITNTMVDTRQTIGGGESTVGGASGIGSGSNSGDDGADAGSGTQAGGTNSQYLNWISRSGKAWPWRAPWTSVSARPSWSLASMLARA